MEDNPSLIIHITNQSVENQKRRADSDLVNESLKRTRFKTPSLSEAKDPKGSTCRPRNASFRHLFNFSDTDAQPLGDQKQKNCNQDNSPFCFGELSTVTSSKNLSTTNITPYSGEKNAIDDGRLKTAIPLDQNKSSAQRVTSSPIDDALEDAQPLQPSDRHEENNDSKKQDDEGNKNTDVMTDIWPDGQIFMNVDIYDDNLMMQIGSKFCRQTTTYDLEDEWSKEHGLRDQAKRDFRLKRQNMLRGRKLGAGRPKYHP